MKLLLTSAGFSTTQISKKFLELANKPADKIKIVFIPTASRNDKEYHETAKKELFNLGIKKENLVVLDVDHKINFDEIRDFDVMYICGGNTFYLLAKMKEFGFDKTIREFVSSGKLYIGVSAGSILAGPNIEVSAPYDSNDIGLKDFTSLGLADIIVFPHFQRKEESQLEFFRKKLGKEIVPLNDKQALLIIGGKKELIG